jgi:hypothetical protein
LPVALVPLWHVEQAAVTPVWLKVAPAQVVLDVWQVPQSAVVAMCVALLPVAVVPLWHEAQVPITSL